MSFTLVTTRHFERRARKFLRKHPDLNPVIKSLFEQLRDNPFKPELRLHNLTGKLAGIQAISITHSYRLTLTIQITEEEILLLDIGSHDEVYR